MPPPGPPPSPRWSGTQQGTGTIQTKWHWTCENAAALWTDPTRLCLASRPAPIPAYPPWAAAPDNTPGASHTQTSRHNHCQGRQIPRPCCQTPPRGSPSHAPFPGSPPVSAEPAPPQAPHNPCISSLTTFSFTHITNSCTLSRSGSPGREVFAAAYSSFLS